MYDAEIHSMNFKMIVWITKKNLKKFLYECEIIFLKIFFIFLNQM